MICHWHEITSLRTGLGQVAVIEAGTAEEVDAVMRDGAMAPRILGFGTNVLGADQPCGFTLLRVKRDQAPLVPEGTRLCLGAGNSLAASIFQAARIGLGGMAALSGIPGSIGGAVAMNAGANGMAIGEVVEDIEGYDMARRCPWHWRREDGGFAYRQSPVPPEVVVLRVGLRLRQCLPQMEQSAIDSERLRRLRANPQGPSAGSVFRNPPDAPAAGWLLEQAGCKGLRCGNLVVSSRHANWILNVSGKPAAARDAWELIEQMRSRVKKMYGIALGLEWRTFLPVEPPRS